MKNALPSILLAILVLPALALAQSSVGLRVGYGIPGGDLQKDSKLSDQIKGQVPIQLDLMYGLTPQTAVGAYASYGFDKVASPLKERSVFFVGPDATYKASTYRVGLQATYAFTGATIVPWVGIGSGLEVGSFLVEKGIAKITGTTRGWEIANFQVGADYAASTRYSAGIFASYAIGRFSYQGGEVSGAGVLDGVQGGGLGSDASNHGWFTIGVRGKLGM
jgi:hypothetical protein